MAASSRLTGPSGAESAIVIERAEQRARGAAGADEAEQPLALLAVEEVGHERPEHGDGEQVEHADPDEEDARDHDRRDAEASAVSQNTARLAAKK